MINWIPRKAVTKFLSYKVRKYFIIFFCDYRKDDGGGGEITSTDKRLWEEDDDQSDLNTKRTRTDLLSETGSGK